MLPGAFLDFATIERGWWQLRIHQRQAYINLAEIKH
jgi:hypothetical protein